MPEKVDELEVERHVRMKSQLGSIDVHCSDSKVGAWITKGNQCCGIAIQQSGLIALCFYDNMKNAKPIMAMSIVGIQLCDEGGKPRVIPWADVLRKLG